MANWISSKLKAAETILQQIDQQAADSLGKNEKPLVGDGLDFDSLSTSGGSVSLKDQLKKKPLENSNVYNGKWGGDRSVGNVSSGVSSSSSSPPSESFSLSKEGVSSPKPKATLTDSDWTQLLSTPPAASASGAGVRGSGVSGIRGLRKDGRRLGGVVPGSSVSEGKRSQRGSDSVSKGVGKQGNTVNGKGRGVESRPAEPEKKKTEGNEGSFDSVDLSLKSGHGDSTPETIPIFGKEDGVAEKKTREVVDGPDRVRSSLTEKRESRNVASRSSTSDDLKRGSSSVSYESSDSESESGSSSGSEDEREREERKRRRAKLLAEKAAAKAVEAIKEKENVVARLEGEKQSLEKILEEQTKQQVQEASKLQTSMMETMEAVEIEKQKHNSTRMEVLQRLARLETANADLAKSLATMQWNLEVEVNRVAELRHQIDLKAVNHEELRRKITNTRQAGTSSKKMTSLKGGEIEQELLEAEYELVTDEVRNLQDKAKKLETDIEMTRKEMEEPTEVEVELKRRLNQLTDHLIQKQTQVESLSSEKATLQFRIEAVSRMLDENKSMADFADTSSRDLESGTWDLSDSKLKPLIKEKIRSSQKHLYSLVQQVDSLFLAGSLFLRRNPIAKLWSLGYLVCLHFWVFYILMSHSQPSNESSSGAVFSLENINNTSSM